VKQPTAPIANTHCVGGVHLGFVKNSTWKVYVFGVFFGGLSESFAILVGGAWTYPLPDFLGIPMWLPLLWGVAALFSTQVARFFRRQVVLTSVYKFFTLEFFGGTKKNILDPGCC